MSSGAEERWDPWMASLGSTEKPMSEPFRTDQEAPRGMESSPWSSKAGLGGFLFPSFNGSLITHWSNSHIGVYPCVSYSPVFSG